MSKGVEQALSRRALVGGTMLLGALAATQANAAPPPMAVKTGKPETQTRTALHQEVAFNASPARVYDALLGSKAFASFTGMPAQIDPRAGGALSMFGGLVTGRNIELIPNSRIVQAWRAVQDFPSGVYSLVKMELMAKGAGTLLVLDHTGFPEGHYDHLYEGWAPRYWTPLKKFLA